MGDDNPVATIAQDTADTVKETHSVADENPAIEQQENVLKLELKLVLEQDEKVTTSKKRSLDDSDKADDPQKKKVSIDQAEGKLEVQETEEKKEEEPEKKTAEVDKELSLEKDQQAKVETVDTKKEEKPKFVFGSTTSFGNTSAFSLFSERKSIFDTDSSEQPKKESKAKEETLNDTSSGKPVFGGGSAFGNAFQKALSKKSIFEQEQETEKDESELKEERESTSTPTKDSVYQKVHLEKKDITTGEEEEKTLFAVKSKLYTLDLTNVKEGWKEKGVGVLRLNKSNDSKYRLLMRADAILKVILNVPVVAKFEIFHGMESSLNGEKFLRFNFVENDKPVQYALKFGQADNATKLYNLIKQIS